MQKGQLSWRRFSYLGKVDRIGCRPASAVGSHCRCHPTLYPGRRYHSQRGVDPSIPSGEPSIRLISSRYVLNPRPSLAENPLGTSRIR